MVDKDFSKCSTCKCKHISHPKQLIAVKSVHPEITVTKINYIIVEPCVRHASCKINVNQIMQYTGKVAKLKLFIAIRESKHIALL